VSAISGKLLTFGTLDVFGRSPSGELVVIDFKCGIKRDYRPQGAAYALMAMDAAGENEASVIFAYLDQKELVRHEFTRQTAEEIVIGLLARVAEGSEPPVANPWCTSCAKQTMCPALKGPAMTALATVDLEMADFLGTDLSIIAADPEKAGHLAWGVKCFERVIKGIDLFGVIKTHLEAGRIVPHFKLQSRRGRSMIDARVWLERIAPYATLEEAADMIQVSAPAVLKFWQRKGNGRPLPVEVIEGAPTSSVVSTAGGD
jgi:hypothetical protein